MTARTFLDGLDRRRWRVLAVALPVLLGAHLYLAAVTIGHSNQDRTASDQGAEIALARRAQADWFPRQTDGVRHPLWSWTARWVQVPDDELFFARGKWLNTALCLVFLGGVAVVLTRCLDVLAALTWTALSSLGILVVRGTYFQPEPLYYMLSFGAMILGWGILRKPRGWMYPVFGVVCGLAYLAKPSLAPFLLIFCGALGLRTLFSWWKKDSTWRPVQVLAGVAGVLVLVAVMLTPLAVLSWDHFGKPMFNYPKYWMWMDDFMTEAWRWQDQYPGRAQLDQLPEKDRPSLGSYLKRHGVGGLVTRLAAGSQEVTVRFFFPESKLPWSAAVWKGSGFRKKWGHPISHRGLYVLALAGVVIVLAAWSWREIRGRLIEPDAPALAAFVLGLAVLYTLLYGWYYPIGRGDRFMGSLWMPVVFFCVYAAHRLRDLRPGGAGVYLAGHGVILISLTLQVVNAIVLFQQGNYLTTRN